MALVVTHLEVFELVVEDRIGLALDVQRGCRKGVSAELQLTRSPFPAPMLHIKRKPASIFDYEFEDFELRDYQCHPAIKAPVAV